MFLLSIIKQLLLKALVMTANVLALWLPLF